MEKIWNSLIAVLTVIVIVCIIALLSIFIAFVAVPSHAGDGGGCLVTPTPTITATPTPVSNSVVKFFKHINYEGYEVDLNEGSYTLSQINALGGISNDLSSVKVKDDYQAIGYEFDNFGGRSWTFKVDTNNFIGTGCNDVINSIKVMLIPIPTPILPATGGGGTDSDTNSALVVIGILSMTAIMYFALKTDK